MRAVCRKCAKLILTLILTVQAICLCCVFSACTSVSAESSDGSPVQPAAQDKAAEAATPAENYSRWLSENYSAGVATRCEWLTDLFTILGLSDPAVCASTESLFGAAYTMGLTDSADPCSYTSLTRGYVASTLYKALGYAPRSAVQPADVAEDDAAMLTLVYYGYFVPDENNCVCPDAAVTYEEYASLRAELQRCDALRGKRLLSFGDSIMQGVGNHCSGITVMIAEKYGMIAEDYAVSRATLGVNGENSHIPNQIREAAASGETADLILLNGGTNDMLHVPRGAICKSDDTSLLNEDTFAGGLETCYALIREYWPGVPVLFIRAHNIAHGDDGTERIFGEYALKIAEKWGASTVDIYEDTDFNTEDQTIRDRYTFFKEEIQRADSIHPTAEGYAKYYLPLIGAKIEELLTGKGS